MSCNIIHEKCEKSAADDKSLPRNAYLVTYVEKEKITYDVVMADGKTDIFDQYYDSLSIEEFTLFMMEETNLWDTEDLIYFNDLYENTNEYEVSL